MTLKPTYIEWVDSSSTAGWLATADARGPLRCVTVGFIIEEDGEAVVLSSSWSEGTGKWIDPLTIPKRSITKRRRLSVP